MFGSISWLDLAVVLAGGLACLTADGSLAQTNQPPPPGSTAGQPEAQAQPGSGSGFWDWIAQNGQPTTPGQLPGQGIRRDHNGGDHGGGHGGHGGH